MDWMVLEEGRVFLEKLKEEGLMGKLNGKNMRR
jgi:hypothetical protein